MGDIKPSISIQKTKPLEKILSRDVTSFSKMLMKGLEGIGRY
jgi:hypothetical protein